MTDPLPNTRVGGGVTNMITHPHNSESNVTTHGGNHEGNQAGRPQSSRGESSFRDDGRADGNDRADKDQKGKKPAHCHCMPWDDDSPLDDSSSSSSSSLDPSLDNNYLSLDEYWANAHAS